MHLSKSVIILILAYGFLLACNPARHIPDGKFLLVKNKTITDSTIISKESFEPLVKQKTNRKILGLFRFHLGVHNIGSSGKDTKLKKWLRKIGEDPVILDSNLTKRTIQQYKLFLRKNGFFDAKVTDSVVTHGKKATVNYYVKYRQPYTFNKLYYSTQDTGITKYINLYQNSSLLIPGERYDEVVIEKERERITTDLKDRGYYFFNRNYITFQADSALGKHQTDIYLYVNRINENDNSTYTGDAVVLDHQSYRLRKIYIHTDYNSKDPVLSFPNDTLAYEGFLLLSTNGQRVIRENVLIKNMYISPGDMYFQRDLDFTYKKLQDLNIFKFVNFSFTEVPRDSFQTQYLLDLQIQLTPMEKQDYTLELEATNTGGNLGVAGSYSYRNKNTFQGAEVLEFKLKGGLEAIPNFNNATETKRLLFFNTYEIGPEVSLSFKKFLLPTFLERKTSRYSNPRTNITSGYNFQERPDYTRAITNFSLNYNFTPTKRQKFIIYFPDINSVRVKLSPEFKKKLDDLNDQRLIYTYQTHIISSTHATWIYTNQSTNSTKDFIFLRLTGEFAAKVFRSSLNPSQYLKSDFDFSYHHSVDVYNNIVYRIAAGYGLPYGNSSALPFEKSFFGGGANSLRAWNTRTLGPGSYKKTVNIEESGDIKIEANIEYRSEVFRFSNGIIMEAAAFVDAGNIWTRNEDIGRPGGKFESSQFLSEMGIGIGTGLRFNFSFFIFRFDAAVKVRDPSLPLSDRWVYPKQKFVIGDITWNFAIGYPF